MYLVQVHNGAEQPLTIHDNQINGRKVFEGKVTREVNTIDTFSFVMGLENEGYSQLHPIMTKITVFNTLTQRYAFKGRVLDFEETMDEKGNVFSQFICEGVAAYLHDSMQRHLEFRGSPLELLLTIIQFHNSQVEEYKRFKIGNVDVKDPNDYVYNYLSAESSTWDTIQDKLVSRLGGEIWVREEDDGLYIDYLQVGGKESDVEIRLSKNLLTNTKKVDLTQVISRLKPLGERIESENQQATDASQERLTIKSVNDGRDYLDRPDLIALVGIRSGSIVWDDVTIPSNLISKGWSFLNSQKTILQQITLAALDLYLIGLDYDSFRLGYYHRLVNPVMFIDEMVRIIGMQISLDNPELSSLTIGDKFKTLADYQSESLNRKLVIDKLQSNVNAQSRRIGVLNDDLILAKNAVSEIQTNLQNVNIENLPVELRGISEQLIGIQLVLDNLVIPDYGMATSTEAGLMSPQDKKKLDLLILNKLVDLNDFVSRVEKLENPEPPAEPEEGGI